ncbi:hypothetical protein DM860_017108 [Cuscuta australis]|uniref:At1g61320/AtMIF1 LRR domain-containing protein n=3 Tax=Cuscuta sect. Cleistogrammica TaxID=1824901 RepID=A0A328DN07_9ASTE|nr:hypothetical protein DM860_017108 [Cuscuta australis]
MNEQLPNCDDKDDAHKAKREKILRVRTSFYAFLDRALGSCMGMDKLNIYIPGFDLELKSRLDGWLAGAVRRGVKELGLQIHSRRDARYNFPKSVLVSGVLQKLKLVSCELSSSCMVDGQLPCLREIRLEYVNADDAFMVNLLASCPNLEKLSLKDCDGLTRLEIFSLSKLEKVFLSTVGEKWKYVSYGEYDPEFDFGACKKLKLLDLHGPQLDDDDLDDILNNHPILEGLVLNYCPNVYHVDISSQNLVDLVFGDCRDLQKVRIDTPNLKSFFYNGEDPLTFVCKGPTLKLKNASISLKPDYRGQVWFNGLLKFLAKLRCTENLSLEVAYEKDLIIPESVRMNCRPPLYAVKHLDVAFRLSRLKHPVQVIESLLWLAPRPEAISICGTEFSALKKLEFTYEKPLRGKKKCGC